MSSSQDDHIILGRINGIYGVQGWVKIFSHTEPRENILNYSPWQVYVKGDWQTMSLTDGRSQSGGKSVIAKLEGVDDRDMAREFMGCDIAIHPKQLPDTDDGYYWRHLIGSEVHNLQGVHLGCVSEIVETGAHDVLRVVLTLPGGGVKTTLIPFVMETFIIAVDVHAKQIQVDWQADDEQSDT